MSKATDRAYHIIRENILNGTYPAGLHLKESDLVDTCGVSRTPVRDALRQLATNRYVITRRNQGVFVNEWSIDDIKDIFELRAILESLVAERAASHITPEQLDVLRAMHKRTQDMLDRDGPPDVDIFLEDNKVFHAVLLEASQSRMLADTLGQIVQPPLIAQTARQYGRKELQQSNDHHEEIIHALETGDNNLAASVMRAHIVSAQRKFMNSLHAGETAAQ